MGIQSQPTIECIFPLWFRPGGLDETTEELLLLLLLLLTLDEARLPVVFVQVNRRNTVYSGPTIVPVLVPAQAQLLLILPRQALVLPIIKIIIITTTKIKMQ